MVRCTSHIKMSCWDQTMSITNWAQPDYFSRSKSTHSKARGNKLKTNFNSSIDIAIEHSTQNSGHDDADDDDSLVILAYSLVSSTRLSLHFTVTNVTVCTTTICPSTIFQFHVIFASKPNLELMKLKQQEISISCAAVCGQRNRATTLKPHFHMCVCVCVRMPIFIWLQSKHEPRINSTICSSYESMGVSHMLSLEWESLCGQRITFES